MLILMNIGRLALDFGDSLLISYIVGRFNQFQKYESNWIISQSKNTKNKIFETT